jgi:LysM repeat protein
MFGRILMLALVVVVLWGVAARGSGASGSGGVYVVRPGDTLWSIARGDGALPVGQRLVLPGR